MNIITLTKKEIIGNKNGLILCDYMGANSASFLADVPKSAVVDHIKVDGAFLEDVNTKKIRYHLEPTEKAGEETWRVAATVWFEEDDTELYDKLANYVTQDFEVYYHFEAAIEE